MNSNSFQARYRAQEDEALRLRRELGWTLEKIGNRFARTRERARQMVKAAEKREAVMTEFNAITSPDPHATAILDEQITVLENLLVVFKRLRRGPDIAIKDIPFSVRTRNCILNDGHQYLSEVAPLSRAELLRTPNFGQSSYVELWQVMVRQGYWSADNPQYRPSQKFLDQFADADLR